MPFGQIYKLGSMSNFFCSRINESSSSNRFTQLLSVEMGILALYFRFMVVWVVFGVDFVVGSVEVDFLLGMLIFMVRRIS